MAQDDGRRGLWASETLGAGKAGFWGFWVAVALGGREEGTRGPLVELFHIHIPRLPTT